MNRIRKMEHNTTGALTTIRGAVKTRPKDEPAAPSWWRSDDDASAASILAMQQMTRR